MKPVVLGCVAGLVLALTSSPLAAQSLADVARQEKLRRAALAEKAKTESVPPKVYTNADLRGGGRLTISDRETPAPATDEAAGTEATPETEGTPETEVAEPTEEQWRGRIDAAEQARVRALLMAEALQNRADGLLTEFNSRDDPAQRTVIDGNRQAALVELQNTRAEIDNLTQQIADIREEARRANVPPGWLR